MDTPNILARMPELEREPGRYFIHRPLTRQPDYEEAYWNIVTDPDGNVRDRLAERDRFLANVKSEVEFLTSLMPGRILDIGCGLGFLLSALPNEWTKCGVELSAFAAKTAGNWADVFVGDVIGAGYENDSFDVVVMHHVIEHIPDPVPTIMEVQRILKPGGRLLLGTPDFDSGCARLFGDRYRLLHDPTHVSLFSNDSMHRFLRDFGFIIDRVEYPYFETPYFSRENLGRLFDTTQVSPPFYGNFMTFYCSKPTHGASGHTFRELSRVAARVADGMTREIDNAVELLLRERRQKRLFVWADTSSHTMVKQFQEELSTIRPVQMVHDEQDIRGAAPALLLAVTADSCSAPMRRLLDTAREERIPTVVLVGNAGEDMRERADVCISIDHPNLHRVAAIHSMLLGCFLDSAVSATAELHTA